MFRYLVATTRGSNKRVRTLEPQQEGPNKRVRVRTLESRRFNKRVRTLEPQQEGPNKRVRTRGSDTVLKINQNEWFLGRLSTQFSHAVV
jgi:hypothetical protein